MNSMKSRYHCVVLRCLLPTVALLMAGVVSADEVDADDMDVTLEVVGSPDDLPEAVTRTLTLPPTASPTGVEHSADGLATANEARARGREFGQARAEEARARAQGKGKP